jgi:hypothetical protein
MSNKILQLHSRPLSRWVASIERHIKRSENIRSNAEKTMPILAPSMSNSTETKRYSNWFEKED